MSMRGVKNSVINIFVYIVLAIVNMFIVVVVAADAVAVIAVSLLSSTRFHSACDSFIAINEMKIFL